ncbi:MAG: transposase [Candidatus Cloacimonetes bacterium]|nr:transposase [Candidatus Cloacimonadota bacterium]
MNKISKDLANTMSTNYFTKSIYKNIVEENLELHKNLFENTKVDVIKDPYYKQAIPFFRSLSEDDKLILFSIIKQTSVDTLSSLFIILDNGVSLEGFEGELELLHKNGSEQVLSGDLQDDFLEYIEGL